MTLAVEPDEAPNPVQIGLLGPDAVMAEADLVADAVEQSRRFENSNAVGFAGIH